MSSSTAHGLLARAVSSASSARSTTVTSKPSAPSPRRSMEPISASSSTTRTFTALPPSWRNFRQFDHDSGADGAFFQRLYRDMTVMSPYDPLGQRQADAEARRRR